MRRHEPERGRRDVRMAVQKLHYILFGSETALEGAVFRADKVVVAVLRQHFGEGDEGFVDKYCAGRLLVGRSGTRDVVGCGLGGEKRCRRTCV